MKDNQDNPANVSLTMTKSASTAPSDTPASTVPEIPTKSFQPILNQNSLPKKRGRKPGSLNKKTIQRLLGERRGRKPKNLKEALIR